MLLLFLGVSTKLLRICTRSHLQSLQQHRDEMNRDVSLGWCGIIFGDLARSRTSTKNRIVTENDSCNSSDAVDTFYVKVVSRTVLSLFRVSCMNARKHRVSSHRGAVEGFGDRRIELKSA